MKPLIHADDRKFILNQLTLAPDEVLVRAYLDWEAQRNSALAVRASIATDKSANAPVDHDEPAPVEPPKPVERKNVSPGASLISKIGSSTKEEILSMVDKGQQPHTKHQEHCKLLWSRGEIKFDGKEWYL